MNTNKTITSSLALGLFLTQINPYFTSASNVNYQENPVNKDFTFDSSEFSDEVNAKLSESITLLNNYYSDNNINTLKKCIKVFSSIPSFIHLEEGCFFDKADIFTTLFTCIRTEIYKIEDVDTQSSLIIFYAEELFLGWRKNKEVILYKDDFIIKGLADFNINKNSKAQARLDYLKLLCLYFESNIDWNPSSDIIPPTLDDAGNNNDNNNNDDDDDDDYGPPETNFPDDIFDDNDNNNNNNNNENSSSGATSNDGLFVEYIANGNTCVKVETTYKNGVAVSKKNMYVPKSEYVKCGIYSYVHGNINKVETIIDKNYLNSDQNISSNYSIYYTINKTTKNPYYFDTGIKTSASQKSATYNQLKDALYQLAIKAGGYSISDNDKCLTILEGKPIVLKQSKDYYSKLEIERLLNSFPKVGLKVMESSEEKTYTLENSINEGNVSNITINNESIELSVPFKLSNERLMGPIQEITTYLGAKTKLVNDKLTITKDNISIVLSTNSKKYYVNKEEYLFESAPIASDASILSEIECIINHLGYTLTWDVDNGELAINEK